MPKYAVVNAGVVLNVIQSDTQPTIPGRTIVDITALTVGPGDTYNGSVFTPRVPSAREIALTQAPDSIRAAYPILKTWANQAHNASTAYAGQSAAQQVATVATTLDRLGTFMDRFADLLLKLDLDS